jgi:DNA-binding transcriptional regulator YdaS (Cro superfamily)
MDDRQKKAIADMLGLTETALIQNAGGIDKLPPEDREMCDAIRSAIGMGPLHGRIAPGMTEPPDIADFIRDDEFDEVGFAEAMRAYLAQQPAPED